MKAWGESMWRQKKIYWSIFPHIFDQATDIGVILEYYERWQLSIENKEEETATNPMWFFFVSLFIVLLQRVVSTATIYALTKRMDLAFYQAVDLLMVRAVWVNHKLKLTKPCNPQRYIELLEAVFEAAPQLLLSLGFIFQSNEEAPPVVIVSALFSLWTLTSKIAADDAMLFREEHPMKELNARCECPCLNWQYLFRLLGFRFCEISSRMAMLVLLWINLGGLALLMILFVELLACIALSWKAKRFVFF